MTDTAERIGKLAERFDPHPGVQCLATYREWQRRYLIRDDMLRFATPGAELGAAFDLCLWAHPTTAGQILMLAAERAEQDGIPVTAALLAAMEEV